MKATIGLLSATVVIVGCGSAKKIDQPPQGVQTHRIEMTQNVNDSGLRFSALVMPDTQAQLAFRIPGYVASLKQVRGLDGRMRDIAEGDRISRGEVLVRIRAAEYQDRVQQASSQAVAAEASAQKAKLDYERASRLYETQSITKPEFDTARAQYDAMQAQMSAAQAQASEAKTALLDTALVAPFNGEIVKKAVELGSFVGPGVPTFSIADTDSVKIVVGVPDRIVQSLRLGQPAEVSVDALFARTFQARISRMASAADPQTRNFEVEVAIPNREHLLKVGMIGSLQLVSDEAEKQQHSFVVPLSAVVKSGEGKYGVFLVSKSATGNIAQLRQVEVGAVVGSDIRVVSGLASGEMVVTTGALFLKDKQRVEVLK